MIVIKEHMSLRNCWSPEVVRATTEEGCTCFCPARIVSCCKLLATCCCCQRCCAHQSLHTPATEHEAPQTSQTACKETSPAPLLPAVHLNNRAEFRHLLPKCKPTQPSLSTSHPRHTALPHCAPITICREPPQLSFGSSATDGWCLSWGL